MMSNAANFVQADSRNLPEVNMAMVLEYLHTSDKYNIAEIRGVKTLMASRSSYVETAVGYVEVKRENSICIVQAKIVPEHKVTKRYYLATATINEKEESVSDTTCDGCPASAGGCKHTLVLLFWLEKKTVEPSSTSVVCYWKKPRLSKESSQPLLSKDVNKTKKNYVVGPKDINKLGRFYEECRKRKVDDSLITAFSPYHNKGLAVFCVFDLVHNFILKNPINDHSFENFKHTMSSCLNNNIIAQIESSTTEQANCKLWHSIRQARITGSKIYDVCHCHTPDGSLVEQILGGYKVYQTAAMKRGKNLEKDVAAEIENMTNSKLRECGFKLINLFCGASPDGVAKDFIIEIKCPSTQKTIKNYIHERKVQAKYYAQCQFQMLATGYKKCLFCVADPNFESNRKVDIVWVEFNSQYANDLMQKGELFWKNTIYPKILDSAKS